MFMPAAHAAEPDTCDREYRTLAVFGNAMMPLYRHGDQLIVHLNSDVKAGDRVAVGLKDGDWIAGSLVFRGSGSLVVACGGMVSRTVKLAPRDIDWLGRILWASQ